MRLSGDLHYYLLVFQLSGANELCKRVLKEIRIVAVIISPLQLVEISIKVFGGQLMIGADGRALEQAPDILDVVGVGIVAEQDPPRKPPSATSASIWVHTHTRYIAGPYAASRRCPMPQKPAGRRPGVSVDNVALTERAARRILCAVRESRSSGGLEECDDGGKML